MPIDTTSEKLMNGDSLDYIEIQLTQFLSSNSEKAFSSKELTDQLHSEEPMIFPEELVGNDESTALARQALVTSRLEKLVWHNHAKVKNVDGDLYYTYSSDGYYPIAKLEDELPRKFSTLEEDIENQSEDIDEIENRLWNVENTVRENVGPIY